MQRTTFVYHPQFSKFSLQRALLHMNNELGFALHICRTRRAFSQPRKNKSSFVCWMISWYILHSICSHPKIIHVFEVTVDLDFGWKKWSRWCKSHAAIVGFFRAQRMMFPPRGPTECPLRLTESWRVDSWPRLERWSEGKMYFFWGGKMEQTRVEVVVLRYFEQIQFFWFFLAVFVLFWKHLDAGAASAIRSIDVEYLFCVDIAQAIIDLLMQPMQVQSVHNMGVLDETAQTSVGLVIIWIGRSRRDLRQPRAQSSVWATVKELGIHWVPRGHFDVHPTHCCAEDITTPRP